MKYNLIIKGVDKEGIERILIEEVLFNNFESYTYSDLLSSVKSHINCLGLHNFEITLTKAILVEKSFTIPFGKIVLEY